MSSRRRSARDRARRELGQNFLINPSAAGRIARALTPSPNPVVELGAGRGALTRELVELGRPVIAVELDPRWADRLAAEFPQVRLHRCDMREFRFPTRPHAVVGNLPFGITTATTRRLLGLPDWTEAVLLVQHEVARKRARGGSQLNAQWSPWFDFRLVGEVPARHFRPIPACDGGILRITRRRLLPEECRSDYQSFVEAVYQARGRSLAEMIRNATGLRAHGLPPLPKDLPPRSWVRLYRRLRS
ncbi:23S ribosomal RNA methyltransferase Erm [Saccharopolyspora sp. TS4A08]|uniref:23S ribosomal RNA methyltransferase Erm n=1 Tax=Saccharopolyspora ipomoeae TaxID=3042027 RepID=A0ABT6PTF0_9PSEU|nr:23S ribosomal RNA methyltransferase Erm [Saccharopolyspora sp. TS4A08]MDI2031258.1 23S ribosomal RNA methyltransferase Erm [Saccharopolyspora sp. TS4A08]